MFFWIDMHNAYIPAVEVESVARSWTAPAWRGAIAARPSKLPSQYKSWPPTHHSTNHVPQLIPEQIMTSRSSQYKSWTPTHHSTNHGPLLITVQIMAPYKSCPPTSQYKSRPPNFSPLSMLGNMPIRAYLLALASVIVLLHQSFRPRTMQLFRVFA
jgi:hypothetical protein